MKAKSITQAKDTMIEFIMQGLSEKLEAAGSQIENFVLRESAYLDIPVMNVFMSSILGRLGYKRYFEIGQLP